VEDVTVLATAAAAVATAATNPAALLTGTGDGLLSPPATVTLDEHRRASDIISISNGSGRYNDRQQQQQQQHHTADLAVWRPY